MTRALVESQTVRFERLLPGPVERVWDYLTHPDLRRTWLAESAGDFDTITRCQPHRRIEFSLRDSSVVSMELEPRGSHVKLVLTHRRLPGWLAGAGMTIIAGLIAFSFGGTGECRSRQPLGQEATIQRTSLNSLHLQSGRFTVS